LPRRRAGKRKPRFQAHIASVVVASPQTPYLQSESMLQSQGAELVIRSQADHMEIPKVVHAAVAPARLIDEAVAFVGDIRVRNDQSAARTVAPVMLEGAP